MDEKAKWYVDKFVLWRREQGRRSTTMQTYVRGVHAFQTRYENSIGELRVTNVSTLDIQDYKQYLLTVATNKQGGRLIVFTLILFLQITWKLGEFNGEQ